MKEHDVDDDVVPVRKQQQPEGVTVKDPVKERIRKRLKVVYWTLGVVVAFLLILLLARDILIETAVVRIGSMVTGTPVRIESFSSSLFSGRVEMTGFKVGNPEGYHSPDALALKKFVIQLQPMSLLGNRIIVDEVTIEELSADFEVTIAGRCNLVDIQKHVESFAGADKAKKEKEPAETEAELPADEKPAKEVVIKKLSVTGCQATISSALLKTQVPVQLPPIEMTDIGEGQSIAETVNDLFLELLASITRSGQSLGINSANFKAVGDSLNESGKALEDAGKGALKALSEGSGNVEAELKKGLDAVSNLWK